MATEIATPETTREVKRMLRSEVPWLLRWGFPLIWWLFRSHRPGKEFRYDSTDDTIVVE